MSLNYVMPQIKNGDTTVPFKPFVVAAVTFSYAILLILRSHNRVHKKGLRNLCVNTSERSKNVLKTSLLNLFVKAVIKCSQRLQAVFDFFLFSVLDLCFSWGPLTAICRCRMCLKQCLLKRFFETNHV